MINKIWALITGDDNCVIDKAGNISVVEATAATGASAAGGAGSVVEATAATSDGHHSAADENTIMTGASAAGGAGTNGSGITNFNNFITGMAFIYDLIMNIELKGRHISIFTSHVFKQPSYIKTLITLSLGIDLISDAGIYGVYDALDRFVGGIWGDASTAKRKRSDRSEGDGGEDDGGEGDGDEGDGARHHRLPIERKAEA